jgi:glycosyltransferase involved in cell wall biosynthesis
VASADRARRVLHFAQDSDTSGFFPALASLHDDRYRIHFATLNPTAPWLRERMVADGAEVLSLDARHRAQYPLAMARLARYLRRERIDILHTHLFEPSVVGLQAGALARTPVRMMTRHYSDGHTRIDKRWHVRLDRICISLCDDVIAVSADTARHLIEVEGAPPEKVHTILNGFEASRLELPDRSELDRLRAELGAEDAYLLACVARLHPDKGQQYLFRALPRISERVDRPVVLAVIGEGPFEREFRAEVAALGCASQVRFLGFREDAPALMAAADLVVLPTLTEAFGIVLAEALHIGTPVVATRVGGVPEIVDDGVDGVLVEPESAEALADAIADLLDDADRRERMKGAGREKVLRRFSYRTMVEAYEALYDEALAEKGVSSGRRES